MRSIPPPARARAIVRAVGGLRTLIFGTLAAMSAPGALVLLGWLQRRMRSIALGAAGHPMPSPGWILGSPGSGGLARALGGLGANIRDGVQAALSLSIATLPFTLIWLLSWWAGWENSFSKGYEQAFVGPLLGLAGVALCMVLMIFIPLALAHQAVERRNLALFELRRVRAALRETGWGYVALTAATVIAALPIFAGRGLIAFAGDMMPGLGEMTADELDGLVTAITLAKAAYVFVALVILRGWLARLYADAARRAAHRDPALWQGTALDGAAVPARPRRRLGRWLRFGLSMVLWFGLAAQIFVGQFLNHAWWVWLTHPVFLLPMAM